MNDESIMTRKQNNKTRNTANSRNKKMAIITLTLLLVISLFVLQHFMTETSYEPEIDPVEETEIDIPQEEDYKIDEELRQRWLANKEINEDYVGEIIFDSGLVDLSFVQAKDVYDRNGVFYTFYDENGKRVTDPTGHTGNDVYIWTNWKTGKYDLYEEGGSVFMDYRNELSDQNIMIYGHHFARDWDTTGTKQFTPLDILLSEENYKDNSTLKLILDHQVRSYVITNVIVIDVYNEKQLQILRTDMDVDLYGKKDTGFFESYIPYIDAISKYDTGEKLSADDKILCLVTCIQHQPQYRQIIICKQTEVKDYE